MSEDPN